MQLLETKVIKSGICTHRSGILHNNGQLAQMSCYRIQEDREAVHRISVHPLHMDGGNLQWGTNP